VLGGEALWAYEVGSDTWQLYRTEPNPGYRVGSEAVLDPGDHQVILSGGDVYDKDRRFLGFLDDTWTYRHDTP